MPDVTGAGGVYRYRLPSHVRRRSLTKGESLCLPRAPNTSAFVKTSKGLEATEKPVTIDS